MAGQLTGLTGWVVPSISRIQGSENGLVPVFPGSRLLGMGCFQYSQDSELLEWVESNMSRIQNSENGLFLVFPGFRVLRVVCFLVFPGLVSLE